MQGIEGKVVVITGASSGIGAETARLLASHGANVVLSARRGELLRGLADEIGDRADYLVSDVCSLDDMRELAARAKRRFGRVDVLFANAGVMPVSSLSALAVDEWNRMVDVNIKGVLNAIAAVLPEFLAQGSGHIIVTSSVAGIRPIPGNAVYAGTKYFVKAMMESFRQETIAEGTNIRTTTLYPGAMNTGLLSTITDAGARERAEDMYRKVGISPRAVADAVLYAVSQPGSVDVSDLVVRPSAEA